MLSGISFMPTIVSTHEIAGACACMCSEAIQLTFICCCKLLLQLLMQGQLLLHFGFMLCQLGIALGKLTVPTNQQLHVVFEIALQLYIAGAESLQLFPPLLRLHSGSLSHSYI